MRKKDYFLWSALLFSLVSHVIAFVQFALIFDDLGLPARWFTQFTILIFCSLIVSVLQFLLQKRQVVLSLSILLRAVVLLVATYPMGNDINVRTTLVASLVFETMISFPIPASLVVSVLLVGLSLLSRAAGPLWDAPSQAITTNNLLFMCFYPLMIMVLGAFLKQAQRLAAERKTLVEQLRQASTNLVETNIVLQEHIVQSEERVTLLERERISRELHDTIGYTLMNIIATMKASMELAKTDADSMRDLMTQGIDQAQKGLAETRIALRALRSTTMQHLSVITAVNRLVAAFENTHIAVRASYSNIPWYFGEEVDATIYRIVQEGITNAIRHGNATEIAIHISLDGRRIGVTITDNGAGAEEIKEGIGLAGIKERLQRVDGGLSAGNTAGGFQLFAWIPFEKDAQGQPWEKSESS